jgi:hypothetical protein
MYISSEPNVLAVFPESLILPTNENELLPKDAADAPSPCTLLWVALAAPPLRAMLTPVPDAELRPDNLITKSV